MTVSERIVYNGKTFTRTIDSINRSHRLYFRRSQYNKDTKKIKQLILHRVIWEDNNGPIPEDCIIHHKDGNSLNNDLSNLICVPISDHLSKYHDVSKRYKNAKDAFCLRCRSEFKAKTKRSKFCPECASLFEHNSKEFRKWHPII